MQNNWLRFVRGCLVIRLGGDYIERFINMCRMHDIDLWKIRRENDICMCEVYASDFLKMPPLLRKTGTKANVMSSVFAANAALNLGRTITKIAV